MICCISGCSNSGRNHKSKTVKFYKFPKYRKYSPWLRDQRQKWINAVKKYVKDQDNWSPTNHTVICSEHFNGNEKSDHLLSSSYIPTIFPSEDNNPKQLKKRLRHEMKQPKLVAVKEEPIEPSIEVPEKQSVGCQKDDSPSEDLSLEPLFFCTLINSNGVCTAEVQTNIVSKVMADRCEANIPTVVKVMNDVSYNSLEHNSRMYFRRFHRVSLLKTEEMDGNWCS